jgi:hypothetical protein
MAMATRRRLLHALALVALAPLVTGCENSATAYTIDTAQHAVVLVREQPFFWTRTVNQAVVVSRLPYCQRKVTIHPGPTTLVEMQVFEAGHQLWALRQGDRWYLASTESCRVQDWDNPDGQPPGALVGSFRLADGKPVFVRAGR